MSQSSSFINYAHDNKQASYRVRISIIIVLCIYVVSVIINSTLQTQTLQYWFICMVSCVCIGVQYYLPIVGSWTLIVLWMAKAIFIIDSPYFLFFPVSFSVIVLVSIDYCYGVCAAIISCLSHVLDLFGNGNDNYDLVYVLPVIMLYVCAFCIGLVLSYSAQREYLAKQVSVMRERHRVARDIHDQILGSITNIQLLINEDYLVESNMGIARNVVNDAVEKARAFVIDLETNYNNDIQDVKSDIHADVIEFVQDKYQLLRNIGIDGEYAITQNFPVGVNATFRSLLFGLIQEAYNNIAKYADPQYGYIVTVETKNNNVVLHVTDVIHTLAERDEHDDKNVHSGLERYRRLLSDYGGSLTVSVDGRYWRMSAVIPTM